MAKALGQEILDFYNSGWPEGYYYDPPTDQTESGIINDDGTNALDPETKYDLALFDYVCAELDDEDTNVPSFATMFRKWKLEQTHSVVVVHIPKEKLDQVLELLHNNGCKVVK